MFTVIKLNLIPASYFLCGQHNIMIFFWRSAGSLELYMRFTKRNPFSKFPFRNGSSLIFDDDILVFHKTQLQQSIVISCRDFTEFKSTSMLQFLFTCHGTDILILQLIWELLAIYIQKLCYFCPLIQKMDNYLLYEMN